MTDTKPTRTLLDPVARIRMTPSFGSGLLALLAVALIAYGISMIYVPAGVIAAGLGCIGLQYQFFGGQDLSRDG